MFTYVVFIEKILRSQPGISRIFVLLRANDSESAKIRFKTEVRNLSNLPTHKLVNGPPTNDVNSSFAMNDRFWNWSFSELWESNMETASKVSYSRKLFLWSETLQQIIILEFTPRVAERTSGKIWTPLSILQPAPCLMTGLFIFPLGNLITHGYNTAFIFEWKA